jgi:hypothetical protein
MFCLTAFLEVRIKLQSSFIRISPVVRKTTAGDPMMECFGREIMESTGVAGGGRTKMRILAHKGRLDFKNLREKSEHFPRIPTQIWSYATRIHFYKIKRHHILKIAHEVFTDGN